MKPQKLRRAIEKRLVRVKEQRADAPNDQFEMYGEEVRWLEEGLRIMAELEEYQKEPKRKK